MEPIHLPQTAHIPDTKKKLYRSLLMCMIRFYAASNQGPPLKMAEYLLSISSAINSPERAMKKFFTDYELCESERKPNEIKVTMRVNKSYSNVIYVVLGEGDCVLSNYLHFLSDLLNEEIFKYGQIQNIKQKIKMQLLENQTNNLIKWLQGHFRNETAKNSILENIH